METKTGSVIDSITAIHSKGFHNSLKVKTDSATAIYIKNLKLYQKQSPLQTSKNIL